MIEKYDAATEPGAKGALLRGEGLYDSHISYWRKARSSGGLKWVRLSEKHHIVGCFGYAARLRRSMVSAS